MKAVSSNCCNDSTVRSCWRLGGSVSSLTARLLLGRGRYCDQPPAEWSSGSEDPANATLQPGPYDGGTSADQIGTLHDFQVISFGGSNNNLMDAAVARVTAWSAPLRLPATASHASRFFVTQETTAMRQRIPSRTEGYRVQLEVSGEFRIRRDSK